MLQLRVQRRSKCACATSQDTPYRTTAIAIGRTAKGIAGLKGEVWLDGGDGRKVVVFYFAELEEARVRC